jgi:hypothetical protein
MLKLGNRARFPVLVQEGPIFASRPVETTRFESSKSSAGCGGRLPLERPAGVDDGNPSARAWPQGTPIFGPCGKADLSLLLGAIVERTGPVAGGDSGFAQLYFSAFDDAFRLRRSLLRCRQRTSRMPCYRFGGTPKDRLL